MIDPALIDRDRPDLGPLALRGVGALVALGVVAALLLGVGRGTFDGSVPVVVRVDDAGGSLVAGADVKSGGVVVGTVRAVRSGPDGTVDLAADIDADAAGAVSGDVTARVLPATVFGTTYVDLLDPAPGAPTDGTALQSGQVVAQDRSAETLELQDTLDSTERILTAVEPAELATTLGTVAGALDGRGQQLGTTLETVDRYLQRLEPAVPLLREDLRLLAQNLRTLDDVAPELLDAARDALVTARLVTRERAELAALIGGGDALVGEADALVTGVETDLLRSLDQSADVVQALFDERQGLPRSFTSLVDWAAAQSTTFEQGSYMAADVRIVVDDAQTYPEDDCPRYSTARGPRCADPEVGAATGQNAEGDPDAALVAEVRSVLAALDEVERGGPDGVGALLAAPYRAEADASAGPEGEGR